MPILRFSGGSNRRQLDAEQDGPSGNPFDKPFLHKEIEIATGIRAIYLRPLRYLFCAEATITT